MIPKASDKSSLVRRIRRLARDRSFREEENTYLVEGPQLVVEALESNLKVQLVVVSESFSQDALAAKIVSSGIQCVSISERTFNTLSTTKSPQPAVALVECHDKKLEELIDSQGTLLVLEEVSDPGNAGTLVRSAESFGISGVVLVGGVDPYNPKFVRASAGSLFRVPFMQADESQSVLRSLSDFGYLSWAAVPEGGVSPETVKEDSPIAVVLGNEPRGLNEETIKACNGRLSVPTVGLSDSLNVAVAGSIILFLFSQRH